MPIFAVFLGSIASALVSLFTRFMGFRAALQLASYTLWISILTALLISVYVCLSSLLGTINTAHATAVNQGQWWTLFFMGLGMFIPANAGAVLACISSVWISMGIYTVQKHGIENYSK